MGHTYGYALEWASDDENVAAEVISYNQIFRKDFLQTNIQKKDEKRNDADARQKRCGRAVVRNLPLRIKIKILKQKTNLTTRE